MGQNTKLIRQVVRIVTTVLKLFKKQNVRVRARYRWSNVGHSVEKIYAMPPRGLVTGTIHFVGSICLLVRAEISYS